MVIALEVFWLDVIKLIISLIIVWMVAAVFLWFWSCFFCVELDSWDIVLGFFCNSSLSFLKAFLFPWMLFFQTSSNCLLTFSTFLCHSDKILFLNYWLSSLSWNHLLKSLSMLSSFTLKCSLLLVRISISVFSFSKLSFSYNSFSQSLIVWIGSCRNFRGI